MKKETHRHETEDELELDHEAVDLKHDDASDDPIDSDSSEDVVETETGKHWVLY
ncbi:MAG: hypothetical protein JSW61_13295 [Candidatus Thorarchaeota archaeon]|nr:MAG: hypothetical protein JSW61_13295 [Candidatus Thorarchaeota archaeon]